MDLDRDGDVDVIVASDLVGASQKHANLAWFENDGRAEPRFRARAISFSSAGAQSLDVKDLDFDGDLDIVAGSSHGSWGVPFLSPASKLAVHENLGTTPPAFVERKVDRLLPGN